MVLLETTDRLKRFSDHSNMTFFAASMQALEVHPCWGLRVTHDIIVPATILKELIIASHKKINLSKMNPLI